jgi:hypothetical protein
MWNYQFVDVNHNTSATPNNEDLYDLLADGWEPFAVTEQSSNGFIFGRTIHLRKDLGEL